MTEVRAPVRVAVVGTGQMGSNHCRVYANLKGANLVGVFDADSERAKRVADVNDCAVFATLDELAGEVDAVSLAVPSALHAELGVRLLDRGIHCLIEKPLANTKRECEALIAAADASNAVLLVGHIERFNPAVTQLKEILRDGHAVLAVDARRMSAVSSRVVDIDVVLDLMVHDLDIVLDVVGEPVVDVVARGVTTSGSNSPDYVMAMLRFAGGALASLTASRITQNKIRSLAITTDQRFLTIDYSAQRLLIFRQGRIGGVGNAEASDDRYVLDVGTERVFVPPVEPLAEELAHFLQAVRGEVPPRVSGTAALQALELVWEIQRLVAAEVKR
ncbi:MAG: Gfo/Idh/MocA family oxidoreductase [Acidimicrobiia bacterium]|nr:Gfo/Idh/MocA family oxidoreductase [Acidimicrobiia bacterium]